MPPLSPLDLLGPPCRTCGGRSGVRRFLTGNQCPDHTPGAWHGRTPVVPDPTMTAEALRSRPTNGFSPVPYGTSTEEPNGRIIPGTARTGFIPSRPCPKCLPTLAREGHRGDHAT